ncbi:MAG TPA: hypothetical protein VHM19_04385, partial [Polyangiales bacterium]|nr:hypothetical protein [Polyangiales bacterium]
MDDIVALCKRRGFIFPASEIYQGINGFWDFGPLGVELKNNLRDAWWNAMVKSPPLGPKELNGGQPLSIVGVDTAIIQNPKVWEASGHVGGFNDPMVDCRETKARYRYDHLRVFRHKTESKYPLFAFVEGDGAEGARKKVSKVKGTTPEEWEELPLSAVRAELGRVIGP